MSPDIVFGYKAIKPFQAEHPIGSGIVVSYEPGDEVPAGDWGRAAGNMVENGRIMRYATNVYAPGEVGGDAPPSAASVEEPEEASDGPSAPPDPDWPGTQDDSVQYPLNQGRGWYTTSDGQRVHGKKNALEAQAALDSQGDA